MSRRTVSALIFPGCLMFGMCLVGSSNDEIPVKKPPAESITAFRRDVTPLLSKYCYECHGGTQKKGDLDLAAANPDAVAGDAEVWHDVSNRFLRGEMPPAKAPQPTAAERETIVRWLTAELKRAADVRRGMGGRVAMRRLTTYEYANTMRDLLGVDLDFARDLPPESISPDGFKNNSNMLAVAPAHVEGYLKIARGALKEAIVTEARPRVYTHRAMESSPKVSPKKGSTKGRDAEPLLTMKLDEFPRQGTFAVRVEASASVPDGLPYPRLRVTVGVRADTVSPQKTLGEIDVTALGSDRQTFELRGRIEDFPLPGIKPKFPGLLVTATQVDGSKGVSQKKQPKGKSKEPAKDEDAAKEASRPTIVIHALEFEGPLLTSWPTPSHERILFPSELRSKNEKAYAREVIARFMRRAYRRPLEKADVDPVAAFFDAVRSRSDSFEEAIRESLALVLISPDFLYRVEPRAGQTEKRQSLTQHELANRLSYFLWSTMPDEKLDGLAEAGSLRDPVLLERQVRAMIADKRSEQFVRHFVSQWLDLTALDRVAVNPEFYPRFDNRLKDDMREETLRFFDEILRNDLSALNLIDADFAMLNHRLANHYGVKGPRGSAFERVMLPPESRRGGLLTQGSFLLSGSTGEESHPIRRAVWLLERLLDSPPPPPPPDVPDLNASAKKLAGLSMRQKLEAHRTNATCNDCHRGIDPWGIPFENFDAVGLWRDTSIQGAAAKKSGPIDPVATLPDGTAIDGVASLKRHLQNNESQRFARAMVTKIMAYGLGRSLDFVDRSAIDDLARQFAQRDHRLSDLIVAIVRSETFQSK